MTKTYTFSQDMIAKGRGIKGESQGRSKLKEEDVINIRAICGYTKTSWTKIAKIFHVHRTTIHEIVHRITWKHI